jgi:8-oxo-dGTP pyrophosphatase MutT (NUDIX family)
MLPVHFLSDPHRLRPDNAAAAIIVGEDGRYLLQLRDDIPGIFYPGHWSCFGGAVAENETALQALRRELAEELEFDAAGGKQFVSFDFDLSPLGHGHKFRAYFEFVVSSERLASFVLHEGAAMRMFAATELFTMSNLTPYDSFALWLHVARDRLAPGPAR